MYKFSYPGLEPVKVLENVVLPYPKYSDEMPGDTRPIVFMYYYRIFDTLGMELAFEKRGGPRVRYLEFAEDSNEIIKYSEPSWYTRSILRYHLKVLLNDSHKLHAEILNSFMRHIDENSYPENVDPMNIEIGSLNKNVNKKLSTG